MSDIFDEILFDYRSELQYGQKLSLSTRAANKEKISIIVVCMNRADNLIECINNWILYHQIYEIIILDYGSKIPLSKYNILQLSDKIKLYRVDAQYWHLSKAYNIAAQQSSGDILMKMDADYIIKENFFDVHELSYNAFIHGGQRVGHLCGFLTLYKNQFFAVNGFNERIINYGYDDIDIFNRLRYNLKLEPIKINKKYLFHIPHSDIMRTENQNIQHSIKESASKNIRTAKKNPWSNKDKMTPKNVATRII